MHEGRYTELTLHQSKSRQNESETRLREGQTPLRKWGPVSQSEAIKQGNSFLHFEWEQP